MSIKELTETVHDYLENNDEFADAIKVISELLWLDFDWAEMKFVAHDQKTYWKFVRIIDLEDSQMVEYIRECLEDFDPKIGFRNRYLMKFFNELYAVAHGCYEDKEGTTLSIVVNTVVDSISDNLMSQMKEYARNYFPAD